MVVLSEKKIAIAKHYHQATFKLLFTLSINGMAFSFLLFSQSCQNGFCFFFFLLPHQKHNKVVETNSFQACLKINYQRKV